MVLPFGYKEKWRDNKPEKGRILKNVGSSYGAIRGDRMVDRPGFLVEAGFWAGKPSNSFRTSLPILLLPKVTQH